jgi:hypothetical protein
MFPNHTSKKEKYANVGHVMPGRAILVKSENVDFWH